MKVIGVTGCVGAGKSTVCELLRSAGWAVFDVDVEAAKAIAGCAEQLRGVLGPSASLHPSAVLSALLLDVAKKKAIEAILLPLVTARLEAWKKSLTTSGVIDSALLFELGLDAWCDETVCVTCSASTRRERVQRRTTTSSRHFDAIEAAQWPETEKAKRATHLLSSEGSREALEATVRRLF